MSGRLVSHIRARKRLLLVPLFYIAVGPIVGFLSSIFFGALIESVKARAIFAMLLTITIVLIYWIAEKIIPERKRWSRWCGVVTLATILGISVIFSVKGQGFAYVTLGVAYAIGGIPAFLTGFVTLIVRSTRASIAFTVLTSTVAGTAAVMAFGWIFSKSPGFDFNKGGWVILAGTFAGLICAILVASLGLLDPQKNSPANHLRERASS